MVFIVDDTPRTVEENGGTSIRLSYASDRICAGIVGSAAAGIVFVGRELEEA